MPISDNSEPAAHRAAGSLLTLAEIADLLDRDIKTIKTWNASGRGRWPHAVQDTGGRRTWRVPVEDLVASGDLDPVQVEHVHGHVNARRESAELTGLREQVVRLQEQLAVARALADERAATVALLTALVSPGGAR